MALVIKDRVKEQTTTTGTGSVTLTGAVAGFESFSAVGDGNTTYYAIVHQSLSEWEVGLGTYTASGTTLSRDTVLDSSNSGSAVNFSAGVKDVFVTYAADKAVYRDASGDVSVTFATSATNATTAVSATNATTAVSATNATTAVSATNATSATFATSATNATTAITATSATNATSATFATSATNATTAITATSATNATNAVSATFAASATNATTAITATSATNATNAVSATFAASATNATTAVSATNATSATFATSSTNATTAITATSATNATSATFATSATNATTAITATSATNATNAVSATFAASATNATTAVSATNATSATFATSATNATNLDGGTVSATSGTFNTLIASGLTYPSTDGTTSQIIQTNGSGTLSFVSVSGGATDIDDLSDAITNSSGATIGLGTGALANDDGSANNNTALGYQALNDATTSAFNVAVGYQAMDSLTTSFGYNTAVGYQALEAATTGYGNTALGHTALKGIISGNNNVAIGRGAGSFVTDSSCVIIGHDAGRVAGEGSIAIGADSLTSLSLNTSAVAVGRNTLKALTTGANNTAVGQDGLINATTGANNTALGYLAGNTTTTGTNNTLLGYDAEASSATVSNEITLGNASVTKFRIPGIDFVLKDNGGTPTTGQVLTADGSGEGYWATPSAGATDIDGLSDAITNSSGATIGLGTGALANDDGTTNRNTALGYNALNLVTTGANNVAIGHRAGDTLTSSDKNTFVGYFSGRTAIGEENTFIGNSAGENNQDSENTFVGYFAGRGASPGTSAQCVGIGKNSLTSLTTGDGNVAVGFNSGDAITSGFDNTYIGESSGTAATTSYFNTAVGSLSASALTTGISNTLLGTSAGNNLTTGSNNTIIGNTAQASSASISNEITLGNTSITKFRIPGIDFVLKDNGGTPTTGQVLTADGSGEGYWATPAGFSYSVITSGTALSAGTYIDISGYKWIKAWFIADSGTSTDHGPKLSTSGTSNTGVSTTNGYYFRQSPTTTGAFYTCLGGPYSPNTSSLYYGANSGAADNKLWTLELWGLDQTNVAIETLSRFTATPGLMWNGWSGKTSSGSSTWFLYVDNDLDNYRVVGGS